MNEEAGARRVTDGVSIQPAAKQKLTVSVISQHAVVIAPFKTLDDALMSAEKVGAVVYGIDSDEAYAQNVLEGLTAIGRGDDVGGLTQILTHTLMSINPENREQMLLDVNAKLKGLMEGKLRQYNTELLVDCGFSTQN